MAVKWKRKRSLWVAGLAIDRADRILLARKRGPVAGSGSDWTLPRGYVKADELPHEAILRVMKEEGGSIADVIETLEVPSGLPDNAAWIPLPAYIYEERASEEKSRIMFIYRCSARPHAQPNPETEAQWFDLVEVNRLQLEPCTKAICKMISTTQESTTQESTTQETETSSDRPSSYETLSDLPSPYKYP